MRKIFTLLLLLTINVAFTQIPNYVPTSNLIGWWPFSGNANDISGNGNNGIVNGATLVNDRYGNLNSAYSFDGINDFIQAPNYTSNGSFTMSCWVNLSSYNLNSLGANDFIFFGNHSGINNNNRSFLLGYRQFSSENGFSSYVYNQLGLLTSPINFATNQTAPTINSWHHFVSVFENGISVKMFLNGVMFYNKTTDIPTHSNMQSLPLFFGVGVSSQFNFLNGKLDDVGFWNRTLTQTEITALYTGVLSSETFTKESSFQLYPNPANDVVQFKSTEMIEKISIYNALGQLVQENKINSLEGALSIEHLAKGSYFVKINNQNTSYTLLKK